MQSSTDPTRSGSQRVQRPKALIYRNLLLEFTKREIAIRYKGSYLGIIWSFLNPLFMLAVYTFVFGYIFKARWNLQSDSKLTFAFVLFSGLIPFNIFAEVFTRAPGLVINNANYVKKVVFPLEILPVAVLGSALFHALISVFILVLGVWLMLGTLHWTVIFLPLVLLPILFLSLGVGWFLASLGTFIRDISQLVNILVSAIMFLTPIFYPLSSVPKVFLQIYMLNPITPVVDNMRQIVIWGQMPDWTSLVLGILISLGIGFGGLIWFRKTKKAFADVM